MRLDQASNILYNELSVKQVYYNNNLIWIDLIVNRNFSNVSGMVSNVANWWGSAAPLGWNTSVNTNNNFLVYLNSGVYYANLNALSKSPAEAGGVLPLFQDFVMPITSDITLTFSGSNPFNANSWNLGSSIENITNSTILANTGISNTPQIVNLSASNVPSGNTIRINFWKNQAAHTPAITNISIKLN
jgi:hypothetical protein